MTITLPHLFNHSLTDTLVYFNSLLAALNARQSLREKIAGLTTAPTSVTAVSGLDGQVRSYNRPFDKLHSEFYELESSANGIPSRVGNVCHESLARY